MVMWQRGQAWRVVDSLQTLNAQLRERYQTAAPPATPATSWGSIADGAHSSDSDHYPHYYDALGKTAVVCARDFPHAASLGMDGGIITEKMRQSRDARIGYVIFAGRIFSGHVVNGVPAYTWRKYDGSDGHWTHFHVSSVHTALADDARPWALPGDPATSTGAEMNNDERAVLDQIERVVTAMCTRAGEQQGPGESADRERIKLIKPWANGPAEVPNPIAWLDKRLAAVEAGGTGEIDYDKLAAAILRGALTWQKDQQPLR